MRGSGLTSAVQLSCRRSTVYPSTQTLRHEDSCGRLKPGFRITKIWAYIVILIYCAFTVRVAWAGRAGLAGLAGLDWTGLPRILSVSPN